MISKSFLNKHKQKSTNMYISKILKDRFYQQNMFKDPYMGE